MLLNLIPAQHLNDMLDPVFPAQLLDSSTQDFRFFLDAHPEGIVLLTPVRDQNGDIENFIYSYINKTAEKMLQRPKQDMIGQELLRLFPGTVHDGIFDIYLNVLASGKTSAIQFHYPHEGFNTWFRQKIEKFENGILVHTSVIGKDNDQMLKASIINEI